VLARDVEGLVCGSLGDATEKKADRGNRRALADVPNNGLFDPGRHWTGGPHFDIGFNGRNPTGNHGGIPEMKRVPPPSALAHEAMDLQGS
jgi:hypothetical protein